MTYSGKTSIDFTLEPTNPGQFFACCGLLELAERIWPGAALGHFEQHGRVFRIRVEPTDPSDQRAQLVTGLRDCVIDNVMTRPQKSRLEQLRGMNKKAIEAADLEDEKKTLESLWRESPVTLGPPFQLTLDWHLDDR